MGPDVVVVGAGPAGLAVAVALAGLGAAVEVVAPGGARAPWGATYGAWRDELEALGLGDAVVDGPARTEVRAARVHAVGRAYAVVRPEVVRDRLWARAEAAGARSRDATVVGVAHDATGSTLTLSDGATRRAALVVDAAGASGAALGPRARPAAWQSAHGVVLEPAEQPAATVLMDWSRGPDHDRVPTFLYAVAVGDGRWLYEETSLAARTPVDDEVLAGRLHDRLADAGVAVPDGARRERVRIPMGGRRPPRSSRVLAVGAAGGGVHPATGYSVVRSLATAEPVAQAVVRALGAPGATPAGAAGAGWDALWPPSRRGARALQGFGLEVLLGLDLGRTRRFFDAFFSLPEPSWRAYLGDDGRPGAVAATMARTFARAPWDVRLALMSAGRLAAPAGRLGPARPRRSR